MVWRTSYDALKRFLDVLASGVLLVVLSPLLVLTAVVVRLTMGPGPVLFVQKRPGRDARPFAMYKFRTMTQARDASGNLLPDHARLTRSGKLLRSTSLDEWPELYNVLRGDMSIVGPRPLLMEYLELYTLEQARRHEVRPGITGWAQVNGRNAVGWDERFKMDVWYVDHRSLSLDVRILFKTVGQVFGREGISEEGQATMSKFAGSAYPPGEGSAGSSAEGPETEGSQP